MQDIKQLLPIEYTRDLELHPVLVGKVQKLSVNMVLGYLKSNPIFQDESLEHLKRINKNQTENEFLQIVLCLASQQDKINAKELEDTGVLEIETKEVSKYAPCTREQYDKFKIPWPVNMKHKVGDILTLENKEYIKIEELMKKAIDLAKDSYLNGNKFNACVLVDPSLGNQILIESVDETKNLITSINHCVMKMTDLFGNFCLEKNRGIKKVKKNRNESTFEVSKDEDTINEEEKKEPENDKRKAENDIQEYFPKGYYYCSNLDLYMAMEPCVMCAMALVHSRIRRVFYSLPYDGSGTGGLNEKLQINNLSGLNHKYHVFYNVCYNYAVIAKKSVK